MNLCLDEYAVSPRPAKPPAWQSECKTVLLLFTQAVLATPLMLLIVFVRKPDLKIYITSLIFQNAKEFPIWGRILIAFPTVWLFAGQWACLLGSAAIIFIPIYASLFLLSEIK
jgi:hypothetical protein